MSKFFYEKDLLSYHCIDFQKYTERLQITAEHYTAADEQLRKFEVSHIQQLQISPACVILSNNLLVLWEEDFCWTHNWLWIIANICKCQVWKFEYNTIKLKMFNEGGIHTVATCVRCHRKFIILLFESSKGEPFCCRLFTYPDDLAQLKWIPNVEQKEKGCFQITLHKIYSIPIHKKHVPCHAMPLAGVLCYNTNRIVNCLILKSPFLSQWLVVIEGYDQLLTNNTKLH